MSARVGIGFAAAAILVITTNLIIQRNSEFAHASAAAVEQQHEPMARVAQRLIEALADLDRAVLDHLEGGGAVSSQRVRDAEHELQQSLRAYAALGDAPRGMLPVANLLELAARYQRQAGELVEIVDRRRALVRRYWSRFDQLNAKLDAAGAATREGVNRLVVSRRSVVEVSKALGQVQDRFGTYVSLAGSKTKQAVTDGERAFRGVLERHAAELEAHEGSEWLAGVRADFEELIAARRAIVSLNELLAAGTENLRAVGTEFARTLRSRLAEPARAALAGVATEAGVLAEEARRNVATVSAAGLGLLLLISGLTVLSVTVPVRRLTRAMLDMANGVPHTDVLRAGVRELDGLALAFNHMAIQLAAAQASLRSHQALLEARVEERTRQLEHLAHHDPLTDLPNRRQLFTYLEAAVARAAIADRKVGLLFLDLDNFKTINDSMGHEFGDRVLQCIGERLRRAVDGRGFSARLGGDEFTLVCEQASSTLEIEELAQAAVAEFQQPLHVEGRELVIGVSVGASIYPDHASDPEALLRAADAALFRAKELGRNRYGIFTPDLFQAASVRFQTEQALRRAIDAGDFHLLYQPQACFETGTVGSVEALLRWRRDGGSPISPAEFLSVAEQSGLIMDISEWVLRSAVRMAAVWHHGTWPETRVAINVSAQQLLDGAFINTLDSLLREHALPARCLEIELTEHVIQTAPATVEALEGLRALGVSIALDDFGTGYSSMTSLEQLPLDRIKIDRSLIGSVDVNVRSAAIVRSIVGLSRSLGLRVTAEGVERHDQLGFLLAFRGIDVQGYLVAKPLAADAIPGFVAAASAHLDRLVIATPDSAFDPNATGSMVVRQMRAAFESRKRIDKRRIS